MVSETLQLKIEKDGFIESVPILSRSEIRHLYRRINRFSINVDWNKGGIIQNRILYELANHPKIIPLVQEILGANFLVWGIRLIKKNPRQGHTWHSDIECYTQKGKTINVWIGLKNISTKTPLKIISGSHSELPMIQKAIFDSKCELPKDDEEILALAKNSNGKSYNISKPKIKVGDAIIFDGRTWHSTENNSLRVRESVLIQYCTPEAKISQTNMSMKNWPFKKFNSLKAPCVVVKGTTLGGVNKIFPGPVVEVKKDSPVLSNTLYPLKSTIPWNGGEWESNNILKGSTTDLPRIGVKHSTLGPGFCPHDPHTHNDEEIFLVFDGEVDVIIPSLKKENKSDVLPLRKGELIFFPSGLRHTIQNNTSEPAKYIVLRFSGFETKANSAQGYFKTSFNIRSKFFEETHRKGLKRKVLFDFQTKFLNPVHCYVSELEPGGGYAPHADAYDVFMMVLEGTVETIGDILTPVDIAFFPSGNFHGIKNIEATTAKYLIIELHGAKNAFGQKRPVLVKSFLQKLFSRRSWKNKIRETKDAYF